MLFLLDEVYSTIVRIGSTVGCWGDMAVDARSRARSRCPTNPPNWVTNGALRIRSNQGTEGTDADGTSTKEEGDDDDDDLKSRVQAVEEGSDEVSHMSQILARAQSDDAIPV